MAVFSCDWRALRGKGLCDGSITRPGESCRKRCVWVWSRNLNNENTLRPQVLSSHERKTHLGPLQHINSVTAYRKTSHFWVRNAWLECENGDLHILRGSDALLTALLLCTVNVKYISRPQQCIYVYLHRMSKLNDIKHDEKGNFTKPTEFRQLKPKCT
jgi:hypothetical protein